jgi:hypothetical protein
MACASPHSLVPHHGAFDDSALVLTIQIQEPFDGLAGDLGGHHVGSIELLEFHFVAGLFKARDQPPATSIYGEDLVSCAVGNKDAWTAAFGDAGRDKSGGKCHHPSEQAAIRYAQA